MIWSGSFADSMLRAVFGRVFRANSGFSAACQIVAILGKIVAVIFQVESYFSCVFGFAILIEGVVFEGVFKLLRS